MKEDFVGHCNRNKIKLLYHCYVWIKFKVGRPEVVVGSGWKWSLAVGFIWTHCLFLVLSCLSTPYFPTRSCPELGWRLLNIIYVDVGHLAFGFVDIHGALLGENRVILAHFCLIKCQLKISYILIEVYFVCLALTLNWVKFCTQCSIQ